MAEPKASTRHDLRARIDAATRALESAGVPSPRFDAEELAAHVLGLPRSSLLLADGLDDLAAVRFEELVARRMSREPLQHIVGRAAFRHVDVAVGPGVFIPRPETEVVAGWAIERARELAAHGRTPVVVDLCAGSAVIALAVADEVPAAQVHAVELSAEAMVWATRNVEGTRVRLHQGDAATALPELVGGVDVVVSNPPYIPPDGQVRDPEVLEHDPGVALWGQGRDGLDTLRAVARRAQALLRPGGWLVVEHADVQGGAVVDLLGEQGGWLDVADHRDLAGRDRFAVARKASTENSPSGKEDE